MVALKLLHADRREEAFGAGYPQALAGHGAVRVLAGEPPAIPMEWCNGPLLGDPSRTGQDVSATDILVDVIHALRAAQIDPRGVRGDPVCQPANAVRDADGVADLIFVPACFPHSLAQPRARDLGWAAAHRALSSSWSRDAGQDTTEDLRFLPLLLAASR